MREAIYDYKEGKYDTYTGCYISIDDIKDYKYLSGNDNSNANRNSCLLTPQEYRQDISYFEEDFARTKRVALVNKKKNLDDITYK